MKKKILIGVGVVLVLFLGFAALQPADYVITRSATYQASPATVFPYVNDLHKMNEWSPWVKLDPNAKTSYDGPSAGPGAIYRWAGNSEVGEGKMTITESQPNELVRIQLEFFKPFASVADTAYTLSGEGDQTTLTQTFNGKKNFVSKIMCLFMDMDKMIGGQFEKGFANLRPLVETAK